MTFRDFKKKVMEGFHFNANWFAEEVQIFEDGNGRMITVHIEDDSEGKQNGATFDDMDRLTVLVKRDATEGIPDPGKWKILAMLRTAANDPDQRRYYFQREHEDQTPDKSRLIFERERTRVKGLPV